MNFPKFVDCMVHILLPHRQMDSLEYLFIYDVATLLQLFMIFLWCS